MQAGTLYETLTIEQKLVIRGVDFGEEQISWVPFAQSIRGNINDTGGVEVINDGLRVMRRDVHVLIRWRPGVLTDMRVKTPSGRVLQILNALEVPRRRGLILNCQEMSV